MLLPSALSLPCNAQSYETTLSKTARPKLVSSIPYQPIQPVLSAANGLLASCRALQSILANAPSQALVPTPHIFAPLPPPSKPQGRAQQSQSALRNEWQPFVHPPQKPTIRTPPRGLNKRRRDEFEDDDQDMLDPGNTSNSESANIIYTTPKRHRKAPLVMPLGLSAADFDALDDSDMEIPNQHLARNTQVTLPPPPYVSHSNHDNKNTTTRRSSTSPHVNLTAPEPKDWTPDDDRLLVSTVLEKLKLSKREWNDCARRLGKDQDSLGRRWKMLVVEGNVGLRRGGRVRRTDLDIGSW